MRVLGHTALTFCNYQFCFSCSCTTKDLLSSSTRHRAPSTRSSTAPITATSSTACSCRSTSRNTTPSRKIINERAYILTYDSISMYCMSKNSFLFLYRESVIKKTFIKILYIIKRAPQKIPNALE